LRPRQWNTELRAKHCNLRGCWSWAVQAAENDLVTFNCPLTLREGNVEKVITFRELFRREKTDLLRPMGGKYPSISGDVDRSLGEGAVAGEEVDLENPGHQLIDPFARFKTAAEIIASEMRIPPVPLHLCSAFARIDNASEARVHKSSAMRILFDMFVDLREAHDRLFRVRGFTAGGKLSWLLDNGEDGVVVSPETHFQLGQLFVTLISHNGIDIGLAVVKATVIKDGRSGKAASISAVPRAELHLLDAPYIVSGQVLSLLPVPVASESGAQWGWVWEQNFVFFSLHKRLTASDDVSRMANLQISVSTRLIEPFSENAFNVMSSEVPVPMRATRERTWFFWDCDLRRAWDSLWDRINRDDSLHTMFHRFTRVVDGSFPYSIRPEEGTLYFISSLRYRPLINCALKGQPSAPPAFSIPAAKTSVAETFRTSSKCQVCDVDVLNDARHCHMASHIFMYILGLLDPRVKNPVS
jgi:hypothetical protein